MDVKEAHGEDYAAKLSSASSGYIAALAEMNGKPKALAKAMTDPSITVIEVQRKDKRIIIESTEKQISDKTIRTISSKSQPLTLSAQDANEYGISDGLVNSRQELLSILGCEDSWPRVHKEVIGLKRAYQSMSEIVEEAVILEKYAAQISTEVKNLRQQLSKTNTRTYYNSRGRRLLVREDTITGLEEIYEQRQKDLQDTVRDMKRLYNKAIRKINRYRLYKSIQKEIINLKYKIASLDAIYGIVTK